MNNKDFGCKDKHYFQYCQILGEVFCYRRQVGYSSMLCGEWCAVVNMLSSDIVMASMTIYSPPPGRRG